MTPSTIGFDTKPLKRIAGLRVSNVDKKSVDGETPVRLCNYTDVYYADTITPEMDFMVATATANEISKFRLRVGDVLITKDSEDYLDIGVPAYVAAQAPDLICGYHLAMLRPDRTSVHPRFLFWAMASSSVSHQLSVAATGLTRYGLRQDSIASAAIPYPPLLVQRAIAGFLDRETVRIDELVDKKKRFIELLEEKRTALIRQAVTIGLDPSALMKDSGVRWLGNIPAHWNARKYKQIAYQGTGHTPSRQHPEFWEDCTVPWFTLADVWQIRSGRTTFVSETAEKVSELGLANSSAVKHPASTVFFSRTASVGFSAIMGVDMATSQDFVTWTCGPLIRPLYLLYVFRAMTGEFERLTMGSTHKTVYMPDARSIAGPLPPREEQDEIVESIQRATDSLDPATDKLSRQLELLIEYRQALITAAVTGQIDFAAQADHPEQAIA